MLCLSKEALPYPDRKNIWASLDVGANQVDKYEENDWPITRKEFPLYSGSRSLKTFGAQYARRITFVAHYFWFAG